jgi:hypothetical protein
MLFSFGFVLQVKEMQNIDRSLVSFRGIEYRLMD